MKRVFFYTGHHMEVFEFDGNVLVGNLDFYVTDLGIEQLKDYIRQSIPARSYMVIDFQDEDFRTELIPHVFGNDRKNIIRRLEKKIFRGGTYNNTKYLNRSKAGRKDDRYMFSSLINVEPLDNCMSIFEEMNIPICGIWSVSYLGERIIQKVSNNEQNILLFTRQMRSAVRETAFRNGKIAISRQAKLERRIRRDNSAETLSTILASNVDTMHRFLISQRILNYLDVLNVYAIVSDKLIPRAKEYCENSETLIFNFVGLREVFSLYNMKNCENHEANTLFAYVCTLEKRSQQQYLPDKYRGPYNQFILQNIVQGSSLLLSIIFSICATFFLLNANEISINKNALSLQKASLVENYNNLIQGKQDQVSNSRIIKESVLMIKDIEVESEITPQALFPAIGAVFDTPQYHLFSLDSMQWQKHNPSQLRTLLSRYTDLSKSPTENHGQSDQGASQEYGFQPTLTLQGQLNRKGLTYHEAVAIMNDFTASLSKLDNVDNIHIIQNPIDIRIASKFTDTSGLREKGEAGETSNNQYILRIIFHPKTILERNNESSVY